MIAGKSPRRFRPDRLVSHLRNGQRIFGGLLFSPTLAANEKDYEVSGGYWHGFPCGRQQTSRSSRALEKCGYEGLCHRKQNGIKYLTAMAAVFRDYRHSLGKIMRPETASPFLVVRQARDFVGWSGVGPISLLIEKHPRLPM